MRNTLIALIIFFIPCVIQAEVLVLSGDTIRQGGFSFNGGAGVDFTGTPYILRLEIDEALAEFNNNSFDSSAETVVLGISLIFPTLNDVFVADTNSFNQGLEDIDVNDPVALLTGGSAIRILPVDFNGELGPALDGESVGDYFARTGGAFTPEGDVIFSGGITFTNNAGDIVTLDGIVRGSFNPVTITPEPATYLLLFALGCCVYIRKKNKKA